MKPLSSPQVLWIKLTGPKRCSRRRDALTQEELSRTLAVQRDGSQASVAAEFDVLHLAGVDVHDGSQPLHEVLVHLVHGVGPAAARTGAVAVGPGAPVQEVLTALAPFPGPASCVPPAPFCVLTSTCRMSNERD